MDRRVDPVWCRPAASLGIGLAVFPVAKLIYIPNYVFNFLTTLVHEIGHSLFAWLMGRPSIPTVSVAGGGVTVWGDRSIPLCVALWVALAALLYRFRKHPWARIGLAAAMVAYPLLALSGANEFVAIAGGVLLEIAGAAACFVVVFAVALQRPFERSLYALWGWWMVLNRGAETILMLRSSSYRDAQAVIDSGLAAGLTSDLERLRIGAGGSAELVLGTVLALCVLALPASGLIALLIRRSE